MGTAVPRGKGVPAVPSAGGSPRGTGGAGEGRRGMKGSVRGAATAPRDPQPSPFPPAALKARPAPGRAAGPWPRCWAGPDCRPCCCCWQGSPARTAAAGGAGGCPGPGGCGNREPGIPPAAVRGGLLQSLGREIGQECFQYSQILRPFPLCFVVFLFFF